MTDHFYRSELKRYCNSDLSELASTLFQKPKINFTQKAKDFGTAFHTLVLEPDKFSDILGMSAETVYTIDSMATSVYADTELATLIEQSERETVRQWICLLTGLPLKAKLDSVVLPKREHIIDLKTTSCTNKHQFLETCYEYDYDRQAAFYLSSVPEAKFFEFVGVMKTPPYKLFRLTFHKDDEFITYGRKKMNYLLKRAKQESDKVDGWRPSAWSRKEFVAI